MTYIFASAVLLIIISICLLWRLMTYGDRYPNCTIGDMYLIIDVEHGRRRPFIFSITKPGHFGYYLRVDSRGGEHVIAFTKLPKFKTEWEKFERGMSEAGVPVTSDGDFVQASTGSPDDLKLACREAMKAWGLYPNGAAKIVVNNMT